MNIKIIATTCLLLSLGCAHAQQASYGNAINLDTAKKVAAAAALEARKNNFKMAIAIVDNHGFQIYFEVLDDTQTGSTNIAIQKDKGVQDTRYKIQDKGVRSKITNTGSVLTFQHPVNFWGSGL